MPLTLFSTLFDAIWLRTYGTERRKPATKAADKRAAFIKGDESGGRAFLLKYLAGTGNKDFGSAVNLFAA